jgi:hypothetical protein
VKWQVISHAPTLKILPMKSQKPASKNGWGERDSRTFIDYGPYFVPERERQLQTMVGLIPRFDQPHSIIDLGCGEGLLAEVILEQRPKSTPCTAWTARLR